MMQSRSAKQKAAMNFPSWAPQTLIAKHRRLSARTNPPSVTLRLLEKLTRHDEMRRAWATLRRQADEMVSKQHLKVDGSRLFDVRTNELFTQVYGLQSGASKFDLLSQADTRLHGQRAINAVTELIGALEGLGLGLDYATTSTLAHCRFWNAVDQAERDQAERDPPYLISPKLYKEYGIDKDVLAAMEASNELSLEKICFWLTEWLQTELGEPRILPRPNAQRAQLHYFIRRLTLYFKDEYETPLRSVTASFANVLFDETLTESDISKIAP